VEKLKIALLALAFGLSACSSTGSGVPPIPAVLPQGQAQAPDAIQTLTEAASEISTDGLGKGAIGHGVLVTNGDGGAPNPVERDPMGTPVVHAHVGLTLWKPGAAVVWQEYTDEQGAFKVHAKADTYMLVIEPPKSALKNGLVYPTIHDRIELKAGVHDLVAPTLPKFNAVPQSPVERSGDYRMTALTKYDTTCLDDVQAYRAKRHWEPVVLDEWITENVIQFDKTVQFGSGIGTAIGYGNQDIYAAAGTPKAACSFVTHSLAQHHVDFAASPKVIWYSADAWVIPHSGGQWTIGQTTMYDPRGILPPGYAGPEWP
jgi:hypothetical protein